MILSCRKTDEVDQGADPRLPPPSTYLLADEPNRGGKKAKTHSKTNMHILIDFGLQVLNTLLKKGIIEGNRLEHLQLIDPFVKPITDCLQSKHTKVI